MPSKENNNWSRNEDVHASNPGEREVITSPLIHRQYMVYTRIKTGRVIIYDINVIPSSRVLMIKMAISA